MVHYLFLSIIVYFLSTQKAQAYLDPGTGSLIIQAIFGAVLAIGYTVKIYWSKIKKFFGSKQDQSHVEK
jgi:O-antigen/teichoic acid export membrane protein